MVGFSHFNLNLSVLPFLDGTVMEVIKLVVEAVSLFVFTRIAAWSLRRTCLIFTFSREIGIFSFFACLPEISFTIFTGKEIYKFLKFWSIHFFSPLSVFNEMFVFFLNIFQFDKIPRYEPSFYRQNVSIQNLFLFLLSCVKNFIEICSNCLMEGGGVFMPFLI